MCSLLAGAFTRGIRMEPNDNGGWRLVVPFTPETTPDNYYCDECGASYYESEPLKPSPCHGALSCPIAYPFGEYRS